jgi:hypothetical protein
MRRAGLLIVAFLIASWSVRSDAQLIVKSGTSAVQFLKIGVGSRAVAMGEAFVATADDISAIYWNPAGLASLEKNNVMFFHANWIADISYDFGAFAVPMGKWGTFGGFFTTLGVPEDLVRTVHDPEGTGERFTATDIAIGVTYARQITDRFSFGISGKYIKERIWNMTASSVAMDVGILYISQFHNLRIGMAMSNFGTKMRMYGRNALLFVDIDPTIDGNNEAIRAHLDMEQWDIPLRFQVGIAFDPIQKNGMKLTVGVDAIHPIDNREFVNTGMEFSLMNTFFLRAGFRNIGIYKREGGFCAGGGLRMKMSGALLDLSYAYADYGRLSSVHRYTISIAF